MRLDASSFKLIGFSLRKLREVLTQKLQMLFVSTHNALLDSGVGVFRAELRSGPYLDGVHDDSETGNGKLVGLPQVVVVQVPEEPESRC